MSKTKIFKDCIHGFIEPSRLCLKFIDQPEFQRLRSIRQLGNTHRVFACANHTRFEHCLGVMHLAGVMARHLQIPPRCADLIQLAGLYHDVGHFPYSHLFDNVLEIVKPEGIPTHHETRSVNIFRKVSQRLQLLRAKEEQFVVDCILGVKSFTPDSPDLPPYYYQIVASKVDVDKLDYLQRDAYHTGMSRFQHDYIIHCATVDGSGNLAFRRKAMIDIELMFTIRENMHKSVYQHPVCLEYDTMYMCMILQVKDEINYGDLWEFELETLLKNHPKTKEIYKQLNLRQKTHSKLCDDVTHPIMSIHIPKSGNINEIHWVD